MPNTTRVTMDSYCYHLLKHCILDMKAYALKARNNTFLFAALDKVKIFRIQTNFRHWGKQTGLLICASQQTAKLRTT